MLQLTGKERVHRNRRSGKGVEEQKTKGEEWGEEGGENISDILFHSFL